MQRPHLYTYSILDDEWHLSVPVLDLNMLKVVKVLKKDGKGEINPRLSVKMWWNCKEVAVVKSKYRKDY